MTVAKQSLPPLSPTGSLAASIVPSGQPSSFTVGGSASYQVTLTNNGTQTWPAGGSTPVHLAVHFTSQGGGYGTSGNDNTWATNQRFNLPNDVAPGASVTLSITVTAPTTSGSYVLEYQPVQEAVAWFSQYLDSQAAVGTGNPTFPTGTTYFTTTPDGQVISERLPNGSGGFTSYYYLHDGLGSVVGLTDSSGAVVNTYAYDPYGNATSVSEHVANPFRYIGAIYDHSTGLYQMGERYYDPSTGRFTQQDPLGGGYQYAGSNPINASDPSGMCSLMESPSHDEYGTPCGGGGYSNGGNPGDEPATGEEGPGIRERMRDAGGIGLPKVGKFRYMAAKAMILEIRFLRRIVGSGPWKGRWGYEDRYGDVWVRDRTKPEWDLQRPGGSHINVGPNGHITH